MAKEKSYVLALLLLSLLLCLSSQVGVAEARRHTIYKPTPPIVAPRSSSPKGKGP
ncbi:Transmembrane protein [Hirschfeldia incana]|nr:Transmembrane protein [Hirschfeldia incana]